jgi:hypothetical protein
MADPAPQPTIKQMSIARSFFGGLTEEDRKEAIFMAAGTLLEEQGKVVDQAWLRLHATGCLALFMPPAGTTTPVDAKVRSVINMVLLGFSPTAAGAEAATAGAGSLVVQTTEAKEAEHRWMKVGADPPIKLPRHPEPPYQSLYPPAWVKMKNDGALDQQVYDSWLQQFSAILPPSKVPQQLTHRYTATIKAVDCWFRTIPRAPVEDMPTATARLFLCLIETLLELSILSNAHSLSGNFTSATTEFWSVVGSAWHNASGIDYYAALQSAKKAKDGKHNQHQKN